MLVNPRTYYNAFFSFDLPAPLADGTYEYSIEKMDGAEAVTGKYYHYLHYPIKKEFSIDASKPGDLDRLPAEFKIQYLYRDRKNVLENGYNAMFFAGSGVLSFGIGMLFYTVIDFGIISTIVYVVAFTSSATGLAASGVYTYRYYRERGRLQKILELPGDSTLRGNITRDGIQAEVEMRY
jgi:hypothetical protein